MNSGFICDSLFSTCDLDMSWIKFTINWIKVKNKWAVGHFWINFRHQGCSPDFCSTFFLTTQRDYILSRTYIYWRALWVISLLKIKKSYKNQWDSKTTLNFWSSATNRVFVALFVQKWRAKQERYFKWKWLKNYVLFLVAFSIWSSVIFFLV